MNLSFQIDFYEQIMLPEKITQIIIPFWRLEISYLENAVMKDAEIIRMAVSEPPTRAVFNLPQFRNKLALV